MSVMGALNCLRESSGSRPAGQGNCRRSCELVRRKGLDLVGGKGRTRTLDPGIMSCCLSMAAQQFNALGDRSVPQAPNLVVNAPLPSTLIFSG